MRNRWYPPGSLHHFVFEFLRLYCQNQGSLLEFGRRYQDKHRNQNPALELGPLGAGLVNKLQLLNFFLEVSGGGGVAVGNPLARIYDSLVYWDVFSEFPFSGNVRFDFQINFMNVAYYESRRVLENIVKGPRFLSSRYYPATAAIVVEKEGVESIGSGSVVSENGRTFILTNKHVIDPQVGQRWSRLSEQIFRLDKWNLCQG